MLDSKLQVVQAASLHPSEEVEFVSHICKRLWVHVHLFVRNGQTGNRVGSLLQELGNHGQNDPIGNQSDDDANRNRDEPKNNCNRPERAPNCPVFRLVRNLEGGTTKVDNDNLSSTHDCANADEEPILAETLKNIELIVQSSIATGTRLVSLQKELKMYSEWRGLTSTG